VRELWGHRIDDPIWLGSPVWAIDDPAVSKCSDCGIQSRIVDFLPMMRNASDGYETRKECPACFAPGYVFGERFQIVDSAGNLWNG